MIPKVSIQKWIGLTPTIVFDTLYVNGNGKGSFFVSAFNFLKSRQILSFPFFFNITTIGDSFVASSMGCMKPITNSLLMSHSTTVV